MARDPYKYFRLEARELIEQLGKGAIELEKSSKDAELIQRLLRYAHTLKGAARVVKEKEIAEHCHSIEDVITHLRDTEQEPRQSIDATLVLLDKIKSRLSQLDAPQEPRAQSPAPRQAEEGVRTVRADIKEMDTLLDGLSETHSQLSLLRRNAATIERAQHLAELLVDQLSLRGQRTTNDKTHSTAKELRELFGGLGRSFHTGFDQMERELRQVRDAAEQLRLVPVESLFASLERTVRDTAQTLGKQVNFQGIGGEIRLDAHVLEVVQAAFLQLTKNAVAHGIEADEERLVLGKPRIGQVSVQVVRRGRKVTFRCQDDGRGVNLEAVRSAALRRGLTGSEIQKLNASELMRLLLRGGLSTASSVTAVSGRGVGLDVVREAASRLGGEVSVSTEPNKGSTFELIAPLSLSSLEALALEASGIIATIPLDSVRRTLRLSVKDLAVTPTGDSLLYEGKAIPFMPLVRVLKPGYVAPRVKQVWSVVILEGTQSIAAIGVDRLLGVTTIALRPLPELAPVSPVIAGASLDQEGNPQLVMEPDGLISEASRVVASSLEPPSTRAPFLVIDDSLTTRMLEQSILESAGYEVEAATSGEEGLAKARKKKYALFLVDVEMPGMDGFTFIEQARLDPQLRDIPAILVTSRNAPEDRARGESVGAQGYIVKGEFDQAALLSNIKVLVG